MAPRAGVQRLVDENQMDAIETEIPGVLIIQPKLFGDNRGFLTELFQSDRYAKAGMPRSFVQDNLSRSARNVLRGLHLQNPNPQGKLLTVLRGAILDVAVDARLGSPTFGRHVAVELSEENRRQFWIPRGFAHGFIVRSDSADVFYKCDNLYSPTDELVVKWDDVSLGIKWGCSSPQLSLRDQTGLPLAELKEKLPTLEAIRSS
jgi:dTDP-4-dehydrorhamnose 3,5-epimerase